MKTKKRFYSFLTISALSVGFLGGVVGTNPDAYAITTQQAESNLTTGIYNKLADNEYTLQGGGSVSGKELFNKESNGSNGTSYDVNEDQFKDLTSKEKQKFTTELVKEANSEVGQNGITKSTVTGLLQKLQTKEGMGSKLLADILQNTKPDYVKGNQIYAPFSGIVGTILGLGAIVTFAFLAITMVSDIAYITLPIVRGFLGGDGGNGEGGGKARSYLISHEAISSVEEAENGGGGNGGYKHAIWIYLKRRIVALIFLGLALLYLVQGQIFILVGYILDLVSGFLGF